MKWSVITTCTASSVRRLGMWHERQALSDGKAERFAGSTLVGASLSAQSPAQNVTGFAASAGRDWKLALFNKAPAPVKIKISGLEHTKLKAEATFLHGRAIDEKQGVTFGDSSVGPDGSFSPKPQISFAMQHGSGVVEIPGYTAAYIEL